MSPRAKFFVCVLTNFTGVIFCTATYADYSQPMYSGGQWVLSDNVTHPYLANRGDGSFKYAWGATSTGTYKQIVTKCSGDVYADFTWGGASAVPQEVVVLRQAEVAWSGYMGTTGNYTNPYGGTGTSSDLTCSP